MTYTHKMARRSFLAGAATAAGSAALAQSNDFGGAVELENDLSSTTKRNVSSFRTLDWQPYFDTLKNGAILVDINSRALHFWSEDEATYKLYPTSVPLS
ncbi:MAG: L,D-transpeptidase, partial [Pseudomonadota bacterium]